MPSDAAVALREFGFDAETVAEENLAGADDSIVAMIAKNEQRILVTLDLDFANIRAYPPQEHAGIIVLRMKSQDRASVLDHVRRLALALSPVGELWIVGSGQIRFRNGF